MRAKSIKIQLKKLDKSAGRGILAWGLIQTGPHKHLLNGDYASAVGLDCEPGLCVWGVHCGPVQWVIISGVSDSV